MREGDGKTPVSLESCYYPHRNSLGFYRPWASYCSQQCCGWWLHACSTLFLRGYTRCFVSPSCCCHWEASKLSFCLALV